MIQGLYLITDPGLLPGATLFERASAALDAGCRWLQYRNKFASVSQKRDEAGRLEELCNARRATLIVNDDLELAKVLGTGLHLGQDDVPVAAARTTLGAQRVIGATCHDSLALAHNASQSDASYLAFGRFFPSRTKPQAPPAPLPLISEAKRRFGLPVVAIGGITLDNAPQLLNAGADALAVCHDVFALPTARDVVERVQRYGKLFESKTS